MTSDVIMSLQSVQYTSSELVLILANDGCGLACSGDTVGSLMLPLGSVVSSEAAQASSEIAESQVSLLELLVEGA